MPLVSARAARRICETRMSRLHYNGGTWARWRSATLTANEFPTEALAGDALLGLRTPSLGLVLRVERPSDADRPLRLMPDLLIGEVAEDARKKQEDGDGESGRMAALEVG